jgi:hypothetical protein
MANITNTTEVGGPEPTANKSLTLAEIQVNLTKGITDLFKEKRAELVCVYTDCGAKGPSNITNKGKGGGKLQNGMVGSQFKCSTCGRCTGLGNLLAFAQLKEKEEEYNTLLTHHQTLAAKAGGKKTAPALPLISNFFLPPPKKGNAEDEAADTDETKIDKVMSEKGKGKITEVSCPEPKKNNNVSAESAMDALKEKLKAAEKLNQTQAEIIKNQKTEIDDLKNKIVKMTDYFVDKQPQPSGQPKQKPKNIATKLPQANVSATEEAPFETVTYARAAKKTNANAANAAKIIKQSPKAIKKMAKRTLTPRIDQAKEFTVMHIEIPNSRDLNRLVQKRDFGAIQKLLKTIIQKYEIQKEVVRFSRIGKEILEIYVAAEDADAVESKVYVNSGSFVENVKPGTIATEKLANISEETRMWIAGLIVQKAARQFLSAPTSNFRKAIIDNYKGPFLEWKSKTILEQKQKVQPARKGYKWILSDFNLQQKLIHPVTQETLIIPAEKSWEECILAQNDLHEATETEPQEAEIQNDQMEVEDSDKAGCNQNKRMKTSGEIPATQC